MCYFFFFSRCLFRSLEEGKGVCREDRHLLFGQLIVLGQVYENDTKRKEIEMAFTQEGSLYELKEAKRDEAITSDRLFVVPLPVSFGSWVISPIDR